MLVKKSVLPAPNRASETMNITKHEQQTHKQAPTPKAENPACNDKAMRDALSEKQIDKMIKDSFPASDPPSTY